MVYKIENKNVAEFINKMLPKKANVWFDDDYVFIDITVPNEENNYPEA